MGGRLIERGNSQLGEHRDIVDINDSLNEITDVSGVPLQSDRSNPPNGLDFEYKPCPYNDSPSRYPNGAPSPIPMSGLEQRRLAQTFPEIRRQLLATRAAYLAVADYRQDHLISTLDAVAILATMVHLPSYLSERARDSVARQGALPEFIVVGSNAAAGARGAVGAYTQGRTTIQVKLGGGAEVLSAVENEPGEPLVGEKTVCVASPTMIKQFLNLLKDGSGSIKVGSVEDETGGLLKENEFESALLVGMQMETLLVDHERLKSADQQLFARLIDFDAKHHNARRMRHHVQEFLDALNYFLGSYMAISGGVNVALKRQETTDDEFDRIISRTARRMAGVRLAKAKGIDLGPSVN